MDINHQVAFNRIIEITMLLILKCYQCHECHLFIDASPALEIIYNPLLLYFFGAQHHAKQEFGNHFKKLFSKKNPMKEKKMDLAMCKNNPCWFQNTDIFHLWELYSMNDSRHAKGSFCRQILHFFYIQYAIHNSLLLIATK